MTTLHAREISRRISAVLIALLALAGLGGVAASAQAADGVTVSGTVTLPVGAETDWYQAASVTIYGDDLVYVDTAGVAADGTYSIADVPAGQHWVAVAWGEYYDDVLGETVAPNLIAEFYGGGWIGSDTNLLTVDATDVTGVDLAAEFGRTISGTISLEEGASEELDDGPVAVIAHYRIGSTHHETSVTVTPAEGTYTISRLLPLEHVVRFEGAFDGDWWTNVVDEYYDDELFEEDATVIDLSTGNATGIDAELTEGRSLSGSLTGAEGAPESWLRSIVVELHDLDGNRIGTMRRDYSTGAWEINGIPAGGYLIVARGVTNSYDGDPTAVPSVLTEYYGGGRTLATATPVDVTEVESLSGLDIEMDLAKTISGTVTLPEGVDVEALDLLDVTAISVDDDSEYPGFVNTTTGDYVIAHLPDGEYVVEFFTDLYWDEEAEEWVDTEIELQYYDGAATVEEATAVDVTSASATDIDAQLWLEGAEPEPEPTETEEPEPEPTETEEPEPVNLVDISSNPSSKHYTPFYAHIQWLANQGITRGWSVGNGKYEFRAKEAISREAMAAFLYRSAGSPHVTLPSKSPFVDVPKSAQFYKEIVWLSQQGISTGWDVGGGKKEFRPKEPIARDAMAAFLYRYAGKPAFSPPSKSPFTDVPKSAQFYKEITWLADAGISTGWDVGGGKKEFRPYTSITREAMAAFLYRYDKKF